MQNNNQALKAEQENFLKLCYDVFKLNKDGAELLKQLRDALLFAQPVSYTVPNAQTGQLVFDEKQAFFRDGQNHVIRSMYQNIKAYEQIIKENAAKTQQANEGGQ